MIQITRITKRVEFDMGHRLPNYEGKCRHLHGHRYVLLVTAEGNLQQEGSDEGMVLDFALMKRTINEVVEKLDHKMMLHKDDPLMQYYLHQYGSRMTAVEEDGILSVPFVPTAEAIAGMILTSLIQIAPDIDWVKVQLYETPTSMAEVSR